MHYSRPTFLILMNYPADKLESTFLFRYELPIIAKRWVKTGLLWNGTNGLQERRCGGNGTCALRVVAPPVVPFSVEVYDFKTKCNSDIAQKMQNIIFGRRDVQFFSCRYPGDTSRDDFIKGIDNCPQSPKLVGRMCDFKEIVRYAKSQSLRRYAELLDSCEGQGECFPGDVGQIPASTTRQRTPPRCIAGDAGQKDQEGEAAHRIWTEAAIVWKMLDESGDRSITFEPISYHDAFLWMATIAAPPGSLHGGGAEYILSISFSNAYPNKPPIICLDTEKTTIIHCKVDSDGAVHMPSLTANWSASLTLYEVLLQIKSLLSDPLCVDPSACSQCR